MVRRFDRLHTRAILTLQDLLANEEEQLDALDLEYSLRDTKAVGRPPQVIKIPADGLGSDATAALLAQHGEYGEPRDINNGTIRDDMPQRASLVANITQKLETYGMLHPDLWRACWLIVSRQAPSKLRTTPVPPPSIQMDHS